MNVKENLLNSLETAGEVDYLLVLISFFFCILSSYILMLVYSNRLLPKFKNTDIKNYPTFNKYNFSSYFNC